VFAPLPNAIHGVTSENGIEAIDTPVQQAA
jgi:hypothetical protein